MSAMCRITWKSSRIPLPPSMSRASAITSRALRVLFILASAAIVSVACPLGQSGDAEAVELHGKVPRLPSPRLTSMCTWPEASGLMAGQP